MNEKYDLCDIDESYLHTVSMTELFDSAYQSKPPIIDGLLYRGTYLFGISSSARQWLGRAAGRLLTEAPRYFACDYRHLAEGQRSRRRELQLRQ